MKEIQLTKGYITIVDDEDYLELSKYLWFVLATNKNNPYAARWLPGTKPRMALRIHHAILGVAGPELTAKLLIVDHIDRNSLNNQRANLRIVNRTENALNSERTDKAVGVYWDSYRGKYKAVVLRTKKFIGWFNSLEEGIEAQKAYYENN